MLHRNSKVKSNQMRSIESTRQKDNIHSHDNKKVLIGEFKFHPLHFNIRGNRLCDLGEISMLLLAITALCPNFSSNNIAD